MLYIYNHNRDVKKDYETKYKENRKLLTALD